MRKEIAEMTDREILEEILSMLRIAAGIITNARANPQVQTVAMSMGISITPPPVNTRLDSADGRVMGRKVG